MASFQTVRLSRGRHPSPRHGVCVAELASMLAHERFSDRPSCACPAVTAFLRGYNDRIDDDRRQDLYAIASLLVGSRRAETVTTQRAEALVDLAWRHRLRVGPAGAIQRYPDLVRATRFETCEAAGDHLGRCARRSGAVHRDVLDTVTALLARPVPESRDPGPAQRVWPPSQVTAPVPLARDAAAT